MQVLEQVRSGEERTERVTAMKVFFERIVVFEAITYIKKYERRRLERRWRARESPKTLPIVTLLLARAMACDGARYDSHS